MHSEKLVLCLYQHLQDFLRQFFLDWHLSPGLWQHLSSTKTQTMLARSMGQMNVVLYICSA